MAMTKTTKKALITAFVMLAILVGLLYWLKVPLLYAYLLGITLLTFFFYGFDKRRAVKDGWRIPEFVLHILTLLGGTVGAFAGQMTFRHKTKKLGFKIVFFCIVALQIAAVALWLHYRSGEPAP